MDLFDEDGFLRPEFGGSRDDNGDNYEDSNEAPEDEEGMIPYREISNGELTSIRLTTPLELIQEQIQSAQTSLLALQGNIYSVITLLRQHGIDLDEFDPDGVLTRLDVAQRNALQYIMAGQSFAVRLLVLQQMLGAYGPD